MDELIKIIEPSVSESVLENAHEDYTSITSNQVEEVVEQALLKEYSDIMDLKIETVDRNDNIDIEIISGDAVVRVAPESSSIRVQYELNADGSYGDAQYDLVEVAILPK